MGKCSDVKSASDILSECAKADVNGFPLAGGDVAVMLLSAGLVTKDEVHAAYKEVEGVTHVHPAYFAATPDEEIPFWEKETLKVGMLWTTQDVENVLKMAERVTKLETALAWYGEQSRLCRLIHSEGDPGRHALAADGGKRARDAFKT